MIAENVINLLLDRSSSSAHATAELVIRSAMIIIHFPSRCGPSGHRRRFAPRLSDQGMPFTGFGGLTEHGTARLRRARGRPSRGAPAMPARLPLMWFSTASCLGRGPHLALVEDEIGVRASLVLP